MMHFIDTDHMYSDSKWYLDCVYSRIKRKSLLALSQTCWELNRIVEPVPWEIVEMYGEMYVDDNSSIAARHRSSGR